ncbi:hypothetical protein [Komagataeibacter europaeus]|uniref:hypothetical protein n=1 Tax=Komagataeibacter europaeus TaxID=33995 RepID=UPI0015F9BB62|nr:hypothetical protein [Komagataeibacter europaeus]
MMVSRYMREASQKRRAQSAATKVTRYRLEQENAKTGNCGLLKQLSTGRMMTPEKSENVRKINPNADGSGGRI